MADLTLNPELGTSVAGQTPVSNLDSGNVSLNLGSGTPSTTPTVAGISAGDSRLDLNTNSNSLTLLQAQAWSSSAVSRSILGGGSANTGLTRSGNNNSISVIPDLADINITSTLNRLSDSTTFFAVVPGSGEPEAVISRREVEAAIQYRNSFKSGAPLTEYVNFFRSIEGSYFAGYGSQTFFGGDFSNDSIYFWVKKFFGLPELSKFIDATANFARQAWSTSTFNAIHLKFILKKYTANTTSFFQSFSDSIGVLANSKYHQLDSTQPIFDITQEGYGVPIPFTANMENKVGPTARNLMYNLSKGTTAQMRRNLLNVAYYNALNTGNFKVSSKVAHGCNLVNDIAFFVEFNKRVTARGNAIRGKFSSYSNKLFNFVQYISNIGNRCALNLRDIYAPINGYDRDFVLTPGSTDLAVDNISQGAIDQQITELNNFAIADATIARNLYANTVLANGDFSPDQFISKSITYLPNNTWTSDYPNINSVPSDLGGGDENVPSLPGYENVEPDLPTDGVIWNGQELPPGWTLDEDGVPVDSEGNLRPIGPDTEDYPEVDERGPDYEPLPPITGPSSNSTSSSVGVKGVQNNVTRFAVNTDGFSSGSALSPTWQSGTATNIPNNSKILGYTIPLGSLTTVPKGTPAILTVTTTDGRIIRELAVGNDTGGLNLGADVPRQWGEVGYNFATALQKQYNVPVSVGYNSFNSSAIAKIDYEFLDTPATQTFAGWTTSITVKENEYNALRQQLINEGRIGVNTTSQSFEAPPASTELGFSSQTSPQVDVEGSTADAISLPPPRPIDSTLLTRIPPVTYNNQEVTQAQQTQSIAAASDASARPFSNKQRMFPFAFRIRGEDYDGGERYIDVDFLLKKIVMDNFNPYKRIATLAAGFRGSAITEEGLGTGGSMGGQTLQRYLNLLKSINGKQLISSGNITAVAEALGIDITSGTNSPVYQQLKSIIDQNKITSRTLSQGLEAFLQLGAERLPTNLMSQITSTQSIYDGFIGQLNSLGVGSVLPTSFDIVNSLNPFNYIDINIEGVIPNVSLGSLGDIAGILAEIGTSGPPTSIGGAFELAKSIKNIICNFQLPIINWPVVQQLLKINWKDQDIGKAIKENFNKLVDRLAEVFNPAKIYETIKENVVSYFKNLYKELFVCSEKDKLNKTGTPPTGP